MRGTAKKAPRALRWSGSAEGEAAPSLRVLSELCGECACEKGTVMATGKDRDGFIQYLQEKGLGDDPNFHLLAIYYSNLKDGGDGELLVKLLRGKMTVKGATYLKKVVAP